MSKAYVHNETTLGILWDYILEPLAGKVTKGGRAWCDGSFPVKPNEIRPATQKDFDYFNVKSHPDYFVK